MIFNQITGRAGRRGFDDVGYVVAQAPEHIVENIKMESKAAGDVKKMRKMVKKKPPEGFVGWSEETFAKLQRSTPEPLVSRFEVSHGMLLNVLSRKGDGLSGDAETSSTTHTKPPPRRRRTRSAHGSSSRRWWSVRSLRSFRLLNVTLMERSCG